MLADFNHKKMNKLEEIGLILILIAFGWQVFEEDFDVLSSTTDKYQLHEKLDAIWMLLADEYYEEDEKPFPTISTNVKSINNNWKYWSDLAGEKTKINYQSTLISTVRILFYFIGSVFVIIPKFYEPKSE